MCFVGSTSGHPAYHASKGAVRIYSKAAAVRYRRSGVRVNTVHPGYMPPMLNATNTGERSDEIALTPGGRKVFRANAERPRRNRVMARPRERRQIEPGACKRTNQSP